MRAGRRARSRRAATTGSSGTAAAPRSLVGSPRRADKCPWPNASSSSTTIRSPETRSLHFCAAGLRRRRRGAGRSGAIAEAGELQPDLVLLDLTMPGMDGLVALPRILEHAPESEVVVLTASDAEENLLAAIRAGASGYLLKTEPPERIATFLRGVARGEAALSGGVARRLLDRVRDGGRLGTVSRRRSRVLLRPASSRCCCSWTSTSRRTRSRSACSSPSTRFART